MSNSGPVEDVGAAVEQAAPSYFAGFWPRLTANVIDTLVLAPLMVLDIWAFSSRTVSLALLLPMSAVGPAYHVVMHARWGQTLGKMAARIRVVTVAGDRISWREALLRDAVTIVFVVIVTMSTMMTMVRIPDSSWGVGFVATAKLLDAAKPSWGRWAENLSQVWFWSEVFVLLFNANRRALHDFIAGTVVVRVG